MPGIGVQVSLAEVLEVRGTHLEEAEIWSIIQEASKEILSLTSKGVLEDNGQPVYSISPESLMVGASGRVKITQLSLNAVGNKDIIPPEYSSAGHFSHESIQKMCVFSLGMVAYWSADYGLSDEEELSISSALDALLGVMCEEDCVLRASVENVLEACKQHSGTHLGEQSSAYIIKGLFKLVLGSTRELSLASPREKHQRSSESHDADAVRKISNNLTHSPPSKNKDRNFHSLPRKERPLPVGRDQPLDMRDGHSNAHPSPQSANTTDPRFTMSLPRPNKTGFHSTHFTVDPLAKLGASGPEGSPRGTGVGRGVEELQETYQRLLERRKKLEALRRGLDVEELDSSDRSSLYGERGSEHTGGKLFNDHKDKIQRTPDDIWGASASSTLKRNKESDFSSLGNEEPELWLQRQQLEIDAMRRAQAEFALSDPLQTPQETRRTISPSSPYHTVIGSHQSSPHTQSPSPGSLTPTPLSKTPSPKHTITITPEITQAEKAPLTKSPRKFFGPEFIKRRIIRLDLPRAKYVPNRELRQVIVVLLDGNQLEISYDGNNTVEQLFSTVVSFIALEDPQYFGLSFINDDEYYFVEDDAKLSKLAPAMPKSDKHGSQVPFTLYFKVKFYVDELEDLSAPRVRHLFYLQLRSDVLDQRCHTTQEQGLRLAGLAMQAEYGNWWEKSSMANAEYYLSPAVVQLLGLRDSMELLHPRHRQHSNLNDDEAETEFIREIQQLPEYGIHFYKVFKSKKDVSHPVWTGVSLRGVLMAETQGDRRIVYKKHPWHLTQKISFSRHRFSIKPKAQPGTIKLTKFNYYTESYRKGQYLLQLCKDHHRFDMERVHQSPGKGAISITDESAEHQWSDDVLSDDEVRYDDVKERYDDEKEHRDDAKPSGGVQKTVVHQVPVVVESSNTPVSNETSVHPNAADAAPQHHEEDDDAVDSFEDYSDDEYTPRSKISAASPRRNETQPAVVLGASIMSHDVTLLPPENETLSESLAQRLANLSEVEDATERQVIVVELPKAPDGGIGITIVGGDNVGKLDLGVFVSSVSPGSPADLDGRIKPGDRIIAINGHSVEGFPHHRAVALIRDSTDSVQLLLSQSINDRERPSDLLSGQSSPSINELTVEYSMIKSPDHKNQATHSPHHSSDGELDDSSMLNIPDNPPHLSLTPEGRRSSTPIQHASDSGSPSHNEVNTQWNTSMQEDFLPGPSLPDVSAINISQHTASKSIASGEQYEVMLKKHKDSLGLNVTGGVNTSVRHGGIYVKSLAPGGPAEVDGTVQVGDRVLEVNRVSVVGVTHRQAVETLRSAPHVCKLIMERGTPSLSHPPPSTTHADHTDVDDEKFMDALTGMAMSSRQRESLHVGKQGVTSDARHEAKKTSVRRRKSLYSLVRKDNTFEVDLEKAETGLGISIVGGANSHPDPFQCIIRVKQVFPGGAAAKDGTILTGDVLLEVNDTSLLGLTQEEAIELLRTGDNHIHLMLSRPDASVVPPLSPMQPQLTLGYIAVTNSDKPTETDSMASSYFSELDRLRQESVDTDNYSQFEQYSVGSNNAPTSVISGHNEHIDMVETGSRRSNTPSPVQNFMMRAGIDESEVYEVEMTKGRRGLGFSIAGGPDTTGYFYIKNLLYEPARSHPVLKTGDRLLKVDDIDMRGLSHVEAVMILRNTPDPVMLRFSRPPHHQGSDDNESTEGDIQANQLQHKPGSSDLDLSEGHLSNASSFGEMTLPLSEVPHRQHQSDIQEESGVTHAEIVKPEDGSGIGLSLLQAEKGMSTVLYICNISPGSPVDKDGRLQEGDRLLQINRESVVGMPHNKAVALIKQSFPTVSLTVSRSVENDDIRNQYDTDSDVDSETLDDLAQANTTPRAPTTPISQRKKSLTPMSSAIEEGGDITPRTGTAYDSNESEDEAEFYEDGSSEDEEHQVYEITQAPAKPPRVTSMSSSNLPRYISQQWLDSLPLIDPPMNSVHYTGRQLLSSLRQVASQIDSETPVDEFKNLKYAKLTDNCIAARLQENKSKNRYRNVLPYDANRVRLSGDNDYINASYIRYTVGSDKHHYIACQGPLPNTEVDFWTMVVEQKVAVIAMLTQEKEAGKVKCHQYWPVSAAEPLLFSNRFEVKLVKKQNLDFVTISSLRISDLKSGTSHPLLHLSFTTWPDQTAPASATPILQFLRLMHLACGDSFAPVVVHCSAGIGRTGALITVDIALNQVMHDIQVDIKRIVQDLRRQRQGMIQTKDQYTFCYKALFFALQSLVPPGQLNEYNS